MSLRSSIAQINKVLRRKGLGRDPYPPELMGPGSHCLYWDHHDPLPLAEEYIELNCIQRSANQMILLRLGCPFGEEPIGDIISISECKLRQECDWFAVNHDRIGFQQLAENESFVLAEDIMKEFVVVNNEAKDAG